MKLTAGLLIWAAYTLHLVWADDSAATDATRSVTEHRIVCKCQLYYDPVCGSEGITYSNVCALACVSDDHVVNGRPLVYPLYRGLCRATQCGCSKLYQPICGTNDQSYLNECYVDCENARRAQANLPSIGLAYVGNCRQESCRCPESIMPVCGTDGKTYRNICTMQCYSRINQAHNEPAVHLSSVGACKGETCHCSNLQNLVCASDYNTYSQCTLDCQNRRRYHLGLDPLIVKYPGECSECICPSNIDPVCASDNKTYSNYCLFLCENQKHSRAGLPDLTVVWREPCNCGCTQKWQPVCVSDHKTWPNQCTLDCENKRRLWSNLPPLKLLYAGECRTCNCDHCPDRPSEVCGSDRQTYRNPCHLNCTSYCRVAAGRRPIWRIDDRACYYYFSTSV